MPDLRNGPFRLRQGDRVLLVWDSELQRRNGALDEATWRAGGARLHGDGGGEIAAWVAAWVAVCAPEWQRGSGVADEAAFPVRCDTRGESVLAPMPDHRTPALQRRCVGLCTAAAAPHAAAGVMLMPADGSW